MIDKNKLYYGTPALLGVLIFSSNFLSPKLFSGEILNFAVWFILSIFAFSCGWIITKTLGWSHGGKIVFAVIVAASAMSVFLISFFSGYFGVNDLLTENLILYTLRNIMLGTTGIFGMAVAELLILQRVVESQSNKTVNAEKIAADAQKDAEILLRDAKSKARDILTKAEKEASELLQRKNHVERQLKEFLKTEKELLKKYEEEDNL